MFLKSLTILIGGREIRKIPFHKGLNLIVDETVVINEKSTGNNVGKTTALKLIDFCLGSDQKSIYVDPESNKHEYSLVKSFLIDNGVLIKLILVDSLDNENTNKIVIERNFLSRKKKILRINKKDLTEDEFESQLSRLIFPDHSSEKPTFRQIISHNIRYRDESINNTLRTLNKYTSDAEYETLYLFLLGCEFTKGNSKQEILAKIKQEDTYRNRLEKQQTKTAYEAALSLINFEIEDINRQKDSFNINENFRSDLDSLNELKYQINKVSGEIGKLAIRKSLIIEAVDEIAANKSEIDLQQLKLIYHQATHQIDGIQKTFDDLVEYHNRMIVEKIKFIGKELPELEKKIKMDNESLRRLLAEENRLSLVVTRGDSFEELQNLIFELNEKFRKKGEYESIIHQLEEVEDNMKKYTKQLREIDDELFSDSFEGTVKVQLAKFNKHFAFISNKLYGEQYALKYDIVLNKKNQRMYKFSAFNTNISSGKKQGEISCFDIAYILFADEENIPCLHFLLNDKKELMHDNQLVKIAEFVSDRDIQFVASILKDKLPHELNNDKYFVVQLSQEDKLFRIEN
jgi:uncharacterized protein YydD (DUF2326 family)